MSVGNHNYDKRRSFRYAVVADRRVCELKIGETLMPALLGDESAGGFSVLVLCAAAPPTDQPTEIHTVGGWYHVRIVHIQEIGLPPEDADKGAGAGIGFRLGLHRMGEVTAPDRFDFSRFVAKFFPGSRQWSVPSGIPAVVGLLFAVIIMVFSYGIVRSPWRPWNDGTTQWHSTAAPTAPRSEPASTQRGSSPSGPSKEQGTSYAVKLKSLETVLKLPGADALTLPDVVKHLELTAEQQQSIRELITATAQAVRKLDLTTPGRQRQEILNQRTQLLDQTRRMAFELLTKEQREEWEKLIHPETATKSSPGQPPTQQPAAGK
jgi:hypothetical protein